MEKKKLLVLSLCAVLIFGAAIFGYNRLSEGYQPQKDEIPAASSEAENETASEEEEPVKDVMMAPDFTVYDAEGNAVSLSDFKGKPVVINFWATWCGYCVNGLPAYEKLAAEYGDDVVFMMVNATGSFGETKEKAEEFIAEKGYTFPVYYDTDGMASFTYGVSSLPATGFVTASGVYAGGVLGVMSEENIVEYVDAVLELE